jgi:hypothetical protein
MPDAKQQKYLLETKVSVQVIRDLVLTANSLPQKGATPTLPRLFHGHLMNISCVQERRLQLHVRKYTCDVLVCLMAVTA